MFGNSAHAFTATGRFVIEREIGHGGMGVVYQALDIERNTRVALKALTQKDALNIYRLKNEFRQLADVSHPNLVTLHELYNEGNSWFFTMELVQGRTFDAYVLDDRPSTIPPDRSRIETVATRHPREASITLSQRAIASEFPTPPVNANLRRLRHALRQLVDAIAALHEAGKLHRDIKPSNVLVTPDGRVVVLDFGLVSNTTVIDPQAQDAERTVGGCVFGTPAYMAPEQAAGEAVTMASDWYALGAMLYEGLTGQLPFDGTVLEILRQKEEREPPPPSELVHGVPDDLDQLCRDLLRRDPSERPTGPEVMLYLTGQSKPRRAFDAQSQSIPRLRGHSELFLGRERHLSELRSAFEATKSGKPVTVLVHGISGIGKSALVRCFANELIGNDEAVVLRGRCYERETVPYKAFDNIIDSLSRYLMRLPATEAAELLPRNVHSLARLFPVLRRVKAIAQARRPKHETADARELRNQAFAALKELLLRITDYHPLVINIDDLQWADMDSARLLSFLIGPPDAPPMLLIGTYRRDEAANSPFLQHLASDHSLSHGAAEMRELPVDALSPEEAAQLSSALLADVPEATTSFSNAIAAEGDGIPFFITELVHHLRSRSSRSIVTTGVQALTLEQVILDRVAGMPHDAQALLQVLSVAAGPIEQGVAIAAAGLPSGDRSALLSLRAARLIRTRGTRQDDKAEAYHDRVREAVAADLHPATVRQIHARIAHAMESYDVSDPERLVVHYSAAGDGMRAGETAIDAAQRAAQKLAFNRAAELWKRAIELLPQGDVAARGLHRHRADALANAGRGAQSAEAYLKAAEGLEPSEARKLLRLAAQQYLRSGRIEEGMALAKNLFREVGLRFPETTSQTLLSYAWTRARLGLSRYSAGSEASPNPDGLTLERLATLESTFREVGVIDLVRGAALRAQFRWYAQRAKDTPRVMHALAWDAWSAAMTQRNPRAANQLVARVEELARHVGTPYASATAKNARAGCALFSRRMGEVLEPATQAEQIFKEHCPGSYWEQNLAVTYRYAAIEQVGGFKVILQEAPGRAREALEKEDRYGTAFLTLFVSFSHLVQDRPEEALQFLQEQRARLSGTYGAFHVWVAIRTAHALLYRGEGHAALEHMQREFERFEASPCARGRFYASTMRSLMARCYLAAAKVDPKARDTLIERSKHHARALASEALPHSSAMSALLRAEAAYKLGNRDEVVDLLRWCAQSVSNHQANMLALYARRSLGLIIGGAEGALAVQEADSELMDEGVRSPASWTRVWIDVEDT